MTPFVPCFTIVQYKFRTSRAGVVQDILYMPPPSSDLSNLQRLESENPSVHLIKYAAVNASIVFIYRSEKTCDFTSLLTLMPLAAPNTRDIASIRLHSGLLPSPPFRRRRGNIVSLADINERALDCETLEFQESIGAGSGLHNFTARPNR